MRALCFLLILLVSAQLSQAGQLKDEYALKKQCGEEAALFFSAEGMPATGTNGVAIINKIYKNHYNKKLNACIILIETIKSVLNTGIVEEKHLYNVHENNLLGHFSYFRDKDYVGMCKINDRECKTETEFNKSLRPYLIQ